MTRKGSGGEKKSQKSPIKKKISFTKKISQEEFLIAADMNLYANPLRVLKKADGQLTAKYETGASEDIIAVDLNKYGSPLDDSN